MTTTPGATPGAPCSGRKQATPPTTPERWPSTDARILAFPVRSLRGVFAWVTCPMVLERFSRDLSLAGLTGWTGPVPEVKHETMLCAEGSPVLMEGSQAVLEEFEFTRTGEAPTVLEWLAGNAAVDDDARGRLAKHLVVLHDDDFTHFVQYATEVTARIGLDHVKRTVKDGALFYQEFLPPETLMYVLVLAQDSRRPQSGFSAGEMMAVFRRALPGTLQIGAGETIGKGLCRVRLSGGEDAR